MPEVAAAPPAWRARLQHEAFGAVLPWWRREMTDPAGGHYGGRLHDGTLRDDLPRSGVLGARLLWTYAEAARRDPAGGWHADAEHAWAWLRRALWDPRHGGLYWHVDAQGRPLARHKQAYAQGFAIYALAAWHRASGGAEPLALAWQLFERLDDHAREATQGGYIEACTDDWQPLPAARLSDKEPEAARSLNTLLHLLEGFTELLRARPDERLRQRVTELLDIFLQRLWQPDRQAFGLFFDAAWRSLTPQVSYGHDIEASWLLVRAAEVLGDADRLQGCRRLTTRVARTVLRHGMTADGALHAEGRWPGLPFQDHEITCAERHWWAQAEAMVGFWDAWQHSGDPAFAAAAQRAWAWAEHHLCDPAAGEWRKVLDAEGRLVPRVPRAGPWECPYHHVRACFELMDRLAAPERA